MSKIFLLKIGFGFITFDSEEAVEKVIEQYNDNKIDGKWVMLISLISFHPTLVIDRMQESDAKRWK